MRRQLTVGLVIVCIMLLSPHAFAQNGLKYRDFEFGMSLEGVLKQTKMSAASARTIFAAPDLIQTLEWNKQGYFASPGETDPVQTLRFDFYNNQLFKITATYNTRQLEGMTKVDLIDAISKVYGTASSPDETIAVPLFSGIEVRPNVLARWENGEIIFSLFQFYTDGQFGLIGSSKALDGKAALSIHEGQRLAALAAPQQEIERQHKLADERRAQDEKARKSNAPNFRP